MDQIYLNPKPSNQNHFKKYLEMVIIIYNYLKLLILIILI